MTRVFALYNTRPFTLNQQCFLEKIISANDLAKANEYRRWQDRQAFLGGRFLLTTGAQIFQLPANILSLIQYTEYKRPYLPVDIDFNVSHTDGLVICAFSNNNRVGVDIEKVTDIKIQDFESFFTEEENRQIRLAKNRNLQFFTYWTKKESVMKADGRGFNLDLKQIVIAEHAFVNDQTWYVGEIAVPSGYIAHIATSSLLSKPLQCEFVEIPEVERTPY
jgi:4'-phosphopantetheinyl transferase